MKGRMPMSINRERLRHLQAPVLLTLTPTPSLPVSNGKSEEEAAGLLS